MFLLKMICVGFIGLVIISGLVLICNLFGVIGFGMFLGILAGMALLTYGCLNKKDSQGKS